MFRQLNRPSVFAFLLSPYEDIINSLMDIREKLYHHQSSVEWEFVRIHLGALHDLENNCEYFYEVYDCIRELFMLYECKDFSILADVFQLECFVCEYSFSFGSFHHAKKMTDKMLKNETCHTLNDLNYVAKLMKMPYKNPNLAYDSFFDVIQLHIVTVENKILKELLKYGVMYIHLSDQESVWSNCHRRLCLLIDDSDRKFVLDLCNFQAKLNKINPETRRRMLAVFRGVDIVLRARLQGNVYNRRDFVLGFRMAYETIPEPIITSNEIENFLNFILSKSESIDSSIAAIRMDYEKLFPESRKPLAPRTLQHLCRCQIRQNLRQRSILPYGVKNLMLPNCIKNYITSVETEYMLEQYDNMLYDNE